MQVWALTVRQPWAQAIITGRKRIEYRSWGTHHRGLLLIHAAGRMDREACEEFGYDPRRLVTSAILGTVELAEVIEARHGFEWLLENPRRLRKPFPFRGRLGLWSLTLPDLLLFPAANEPV